MRSDLFRMVGMRLFLVALMNFIFFSPAAQDLHFSQLFLSPHSLNPAYTGSQPGLNRFSSIYRNQRSTVSKPFTSFSAGLDVNKKSGYNYIGGGISFFSDRSGPGRLAVSRISFSGAYHFEWGHQTFSIGIQPALVHKSVQESTYPQQYDPASGDFNIGLANGESQPPGKVFYFDMQAGWTINLRRDVFALTAGQGFYHIIKPDESLIPGQKAQLPVR